MHRLTRVVAVVATAGLLQGTGIFLPSAFAAASKEPAMQKWVNGSMSLERELPPINLQQGLFPQNDSTVAPARSHKTSINPVQYSDNPTMPGEGTPQRSQGSGTR